MREEVISVYKFEELSEEAKETARAWWREGAFDYDWYQFTYEGFIETTKDFDVTKIYFSGFWSQGDGAMFEYEGISEELVDRAIEHVMTINKQPRWKIDAVKAGKYVNASGIHSGHYYHEKCCSHNINIEVNNTDHTNLEDLIDLYYEDFEDFIIEEYENLASDLYRRLEEEYSYLNSDEVVDETIMANEYEFTEDGKVY